MNDAAAASPAVGPAGPGDNLPPADADPIHDRLVETYAELEKRTAKLLAGIARVPPIDSSDLAQSATDFRKQINSHLKKLEALRVSEKAPFYDGVKTVDGFFKGMSTPLKQGYEDIGANLKKHLRRVEEEARRVAEEQARVERERERQEREVAERLARDASDEVALQLAVEAETRAQQAKADAVVAERAAKAKPAEFSRVRGDLGGVASLKQFWDFRVTARPHIDLEALRPYIKDEHIDQAIRGYVVVHKGDQPLPGVEIFQNTRL